MMQMFVGVAMAARFRLREDAQRAKESVRNEGHSG
jgi:hypothetical protein